MDKESKGPGAKVVLAGVAVLLLVMGIAGWWLIWGAKPEEGPPAPMVEGEGPTPATMQSSRARARDGARQGAPARRPAVANPDTIAQAEMRVLKGHEDGVLSLAFSPDGRFLASSGADHQVILWDVGQGTQVKVIPNDRFVTKLAFSRDGTRLIMASYDHHVDVVEVASGASVFSNAEGNVVVGVGFLPDGTHFVSATERALHFWELGKDEPIAAASADGRIAKLAVLRSGEVITGDLKGDIDVWSATGGKVAHHARPRANRPMKKDEGNNWILGLAERADGKVLISDISGLWEWDRAADTFRWFAKSLFSMDGSFGSDQYCYGGAQGETTIWVREATERGGMYMFRTPWTVQAIAAADEAGWLAYAGGGGFDKELGGWNSDGSAEIRLLKLTNLENAVAAARDAAAGKVQSDSSKTNTIDEGDVAIPWQ